MILTDPFEKYPTPEAAQDAMKHFYGCCVFTGRLWIKNDSEGGVHLDGMHIFPRKAYPQLSCYAINTLPGVRAHHTLFDRLRVSKNGVSFYRDSTVQERLAILASRTHPDLRARVRDQLALLAELVIMRLDMKWPEPVAGAFA